MVVKNSEKKPNTCSQADFSQDKPQERKGARWESEHMSSTAEMCLIHGERIQQWNPT